MYLMSKYGVPISKAMDSVYAAGLIDTAKRFGNAMGRTVYNTQVQNRYYDKTPKKRRGCIIRSFTNMRVS